MFLNFWRIAWSSCNEWLIPDKTGFRDHIRKTKMKAREWIFADICWKWSTYICIFNQIINSQRQEIRCGHTWAPVHWNIYHNTFILLSTFQLTSTWCSALLYLFDEQRKHERSYSSDNWISSIILSTDIIFWALESSIHIWHKYGHTMFSILGAWINYSISTKYKRTKSKFR